MTRILELINRNNSEVIAYRQKSNKPLLVIREYRVIFLNYPAILEMHLTEDSFLHFFTDKDRWFFFANSLPTGFPLRSAYPSRKNSGAHIFSAALITMLMAKSPAKLKESYAVKRTKDTYEDGSIIYEILFDKPIKKNGCAVI